MGLRLQLHSNFSSIHLYSCYTSVHVMNCLLNYPQSNADLMFGGITIVCGIVGTLAGGFILDLINSTISNAFKPSLRLEKFLSLPRRSSETSMQ
ncbi:hypothetical protein ZIOFF_039864 [Zingiber officinale]|uniref:Uncharacterized protein n=1 Tax=Zingiber officinale TaxID=94328 RepID=A0A8J5L448_ZINOF|nr:hypothetical protein ZIOFF_043993 [Zingiber officinale]KAG6500050.1 hypothetical protein ZIOFF_039864 [Zingiber officinale]